MSILQQFFQITTTKKYRNKVTSFCQTHVKVSDVFFTSLKLFKQRNKKLR